MECSAWAGSSIAVRRRAPSVLCLALAALSAMLLGGWVRAGSVLFPAEFDDIVTMWRRAGPTNETIARQLESSEWATLIVPYSQLGDLRGPEMRGDALKVADSELSKGRYGATLPLYRYGIGTIIVINDRRLAALEPTQLGESHERQEAGYLERVRRVTLAAILAHEATHSMQFCRGEIYPGPGTLPFPGHDQQDELAAYLNINGIYETELGVSLPASRYESIVHQDYSNLPALAMSAPERTRAFITQRQLVDTHDGYGRPTSFAEALERVRRSQERIP